MIYNDIALFVAVAKAGSFSGAAKDLGLSLSMVSRRILDFEAAIGVKLFERNTRNVRLTHEGRSLLDRTEALIEGLNNAVRARFAGDGTIRVTAPPLAARTQLGSRLLDFLSRNPEIKLDLVATNSQLDLIEDNIDIARLKPVSRTLYALYPSRRLLPTHLRNLIEYIRTPREQTPGIGRRTQVQGRVSLHAPKPSKVDKKLG